MHTKHTEKPTFRIWRYIYTAVLFVIMPFIVLIGIFKVLLEKTQTRRRFTQRLAIFYPPPNPKDSSTQSLLIHCVSVGEVVAAAPLIKNLLQYNPAFKITVTTTTATGAAQVARELDDKVEHVYLPFDLPFMMSALLNRTRPSQVLITEVELWPNMVHQCWLRDIPVILINARMTDRSAIRYGQLSGLISPMLGKLYHVCAQGQRDYDNYLSLGVKPDKLTLSNNIKFDQTFDHSEYERAQQLKEQLRLEQHQVIVAGSTHDPEESILLNAYKQLKREYPELVMLLVPRHPERFENVASMCKSLSFSSCKLSEATDLSDTPDIVVVDQMGVLRACYGLADIAFVGGSLSGRGGHNALEPAHFSVPIIMGPSRFNNPQICLSLAEAGALKEVSDIHELTKQLAQWLREQDTALAAGGAGLKVLQNNTGAIAVTMAIITRAYSESSSNSRVSST